MIVSLRGIVIDIALNYAVIECNGVGYQVLAAPQTLATLTRDTETFLLTSHVIREEAQTLYGFTNPEAREMFALLQTVSGLGPKLAMAAQSVFNSTELAQAIATNEAKTLQKIPGVGKRMAERMVVDLKDKVTAFLTEPSNISSTASMPTIMANSVAEQVLEALVGLGFTEKAAEPSVVAVLSEHPDWDTAQVLRATLSALGKK